MKKLINQELIKAGKRIQELRRSRSLSCVPVFLILTLCCFALSSCETPSQAASSGEFLFGSDWATQKLIANPAAGPTITHLATVLPQLSYGKIPARELGQLSKQLESLNTSNMSADERAVQTRIQSAIGAASTLSGQNPTAYQGIAAAALQSVANGMNYSVEFNAGRNEPTDPPTVADAKAKAKARKGAKHP